MSFLIHIDIFFRVVLHGCNDAYTDDANTLSPATDGMLLISTMFSFFQWW
jgi:hypothetical protein